MTSTVDRIAISIKTNDVKKTLESEDEEELDSFESYAEQEKRVNGVHGNIYQLKVLMLFLHRGVACKYSFRLGTEIREARKFDDLVFEYIQEKRKYFRLLQAKHKLDESKKITADSLLNDASGDYSLVKYFLSYHGCKTESLFQNGSIKDIIICTNINFDLESLKKADIQVQKVTEKDDIFDINNATKEPMRYRFKRSIIPKLKQRLQFFNKNKINYSDVDLQDFVDRLIFAVNQPNEEELGKIVKKEIGKEFDFVTTENVYNKLFIEMLDWMRGTSNKLFLSHKEGNNFFAEIRKRIPVWFGIRNPINSFIGREDQIKLMNQLLKKDNNCSNIVCITGLGGVGKSELVRKFIFKFSQDFDNKIIWINAETYQSLSDSFRRLACDILNISTKSFDGKEKDINSIVQETYNHFRTSKSLFIFDNAEKYASLNEADNGIERFLPTSIGNKPHILVTSRYQNWPKNFEILSLDVFSKKEARRFIRRALSIPIVENFPGDKSVFDLAEKLQCLPLALQQAVSYIYTQDQNLKNIGKSFKINNYLDRYDQRTKELLNFEFPDDSDNVYGKTMYTTWNITLDAIKEKKNGNDALKILYIASFLAPDNIPIDILSHFIGREVVSAVELLRQYSLIIANAENKSFNIHRLMQQVIIMKMMEQKQENEELNGIIEYFCKKFKLQNMEHALSVWNHTKKDIDLIEKKPQFPFVIGSALFENFRLNEAILFLSEASELFKRMKINDQNVRGIQLSLLNLLARAYTRNSNYNKAFDGFHEVYFQQRMEYGSNSSIALQTKYNIGQILFKLGKYKEAMECYEDIIIEYDDFQVSNDEFNPLLVQKSIGELYIYLGQHEKALKILNFVYGIQKSLMGENHHDTLETKTNIAHALARTEKFDEAQNLYQQIHNFKAGGTHTGDQIEILKSKFNTACMYSHKQQFDTALKMYEEVYAGYKKIYDDDDDHPTVLFVQCSIASTYSQKKEYSKAMKILSKVLHKQTTIMGPDYPDTVRSGEVMINLLHKQGKFEEALQMAEQVVRRKIKIVGDCHPDLPNIQNLLADLYNKTGQHDKAIEQYEKMIAIQEKTCGKRHEETLLTRHNMAMAYGTHKKEYDKAIEILQEVHPIQEEVLGPEHNHTMYTMYNLFALRQDKQKEEMRKIRSTGTEKSIEKLAEHLKGGWNADTKDEFGSTLLHKAVQHDNIQGMKVLLQHKADVTLADRRGTTALHFAASKSNTEYILSLLKSTPRNKLEGYLNAKMLSTGDTALHIAAKSASLSIVKILLQRGAIYNIKNNMNKWPVDTSKDKKVTEYLKSIGKFFLDVKNDNTGFISELKNLKAEDLLAVTNARNLQGNTLLQVAIGYKRKNTANEILKLLKGEKN